MRPATHTMDAQSSLASERMRTSSSETNPLWRQMFERLPLGIAVLDAATQTTLWTNAALESLLEAASGLGKVDGLLPTEYLPGLDKGLWRDTVAGVLCGPHCGKASPPQRVRFVHQGTRNITHWEWSVQPADALLPPHYLMLSVHNVSEIVMNERLLASEARKAERARKRAEALSRLAQMVNASETTPEMLRAVTHEAAAFLDTPHAAVLLLTPDGQRFEVGYSIGLQRDGKKGALLLDRARTLAGRAVAQRKTLHLANVGAHNIQVPLLEGGAPPMTILSSPICHDERTYGVVEVYFAQPRDLPDDARSLLTAFADQTAVALHKADLHEQIAEQRRQLQSIFDNAPVGIIYFNSDLRVAAINAAASSIFGLPLEGAAGKSYADFLRDMPPGLLEKVRAGTPFHASHSILHSDRPDREEIVCDISLLPVPNENGQVAGVMLLGFEVTELVKARQEADAARNAAEAALNQARAAHAQMVQMEKMRAIGELASGVAHDFNNALMAILGYTELAEGSLDDSQALATHLAIIRKAAEDASSTVQRLQRFARQRVTTNGEPTDVNIIVQDVVEMTRPRWKDTAQKEGRTYRIDVDLQPVPLILAEPSGLREVLVNMIHNALHAMPNGGTLSLRTRPYGDNQVEIEIGDTGVGMAPEVVARIFDPFFTTRGVEGTGLGLAVSWTIIQRHGGTIDVQSAPGQGTHFFIRLPVTAEEGRGPVASQVPAMLPLPMEARLLVVDDEPFVASVLTSILSRHGHRVTVVHSAEEALAVLEEKAGEYHMVLTDHGMPGMTGLQLVEEIKHRWSELPVVLLTGWGENLLQTHVAEVLPDAVLAKPINQTDLLNAVAMVLRKKVAPPEGDPAPAEERPAATQEALYPQAQERKRR